MVGDAFMKYHVNPIFIKYSKGTPIKMNIFWYYSKNKFIYMFLYLFRFRITAVMRFKNSNPVSK